ncbi:MAG: polysaccharide deacetylase family protein [Endomicrobium sp.]|jgi:peptidoglycan/xylan/chitin deacetylase (PgdA/CDA1 family)|nr:polysaccharide deacetylase family protein [Endomicrobium sp.]
MKRIVVFIFLFFTNLCVCFAQTKIFYSDGPKNVKKIALTFDDGPSKATKKILAILKKKGIRATFFLVGIRVEANPDIVKAIVSAGHEVANHTYQHINFYSYNVENKTDKVERELLQGKNAIRKITNVETFLVRFPYGYSKSDAVEVARRYGCHVINWSFGCDWKKITVEEMHNKYRKAVRNGAIFLMHDLNESSKVLLFLSDFIDELKKSGYEIVTVSELLKLSHL